MVRSAPQLLSLVTFLALAGCLSSAEVRDLAQAPDGDRVLSEPIDEDEREATESEELISDPISAKPAPMADPAPEMDGNLGMRTRPKTKKDIGRANHNRVEIGGSRRPETEFAPQKQKPGQPTMRRDTEGYTDYGINGFDLVERDGLSTFAVDVDTASYTLSRRKLTDGYLPSHAGVRVEEFVNYFPYEYKQPKAGEPFGVDVEATPSPWNPRNHLVRIGIQGKRIHYDEHKPVHLTFLVDTSGSMSSSDKMGLVKKTLIMLTEELQDGDTVAIATYAGSTQIVLSPTPISQQKKIISSLARLSSGGSTAMASGIDLAYQMADEAYVPGTVNRVVVCSDGDANVGRTSHSEISSQIKRYAQKGITLTTLGFGTGNYQDTMMERLANDGDGNYFYIDSERESRRIFVDKLNSTMEIIAKDVKLQVAFNDEAVIAYRLVGYENRDIADHDFRNDKVDAGEIGSGHQVTALYEVMLKDELPSTIATVHVRNKAPGPDSPAVERTYDVSKEVIRTRFAEGTDQYRVAVAAMSFAELLRNSPHLSEVTYRQVQELAQSAKRPEYPEDAELVELISRAAELSGEVSYTSR